MATRAYVGLLLVSLLGVPLSGQAPAAGADTVLADRVLTREAPAITLHLLKAGVYRATIEPDRDTLELRPVHPRGPSTLVSRAASGARGVWELYVTGDGDFALGVPNIPVGSSVRVRVVGDRVAEHRLAERINHGLSLGLGVAGGVHGTYQIDNAPPISGATGGRDLDIYLLIDGGGRLGGAIGVSRQTIRSEGQTVDYAFAEPRVRLKALGSPAGRRVDLGASLRVALGNSNSMFSNDPSLLAPGVFLSTHLARRSGNHGLSLLLTGYYAMLSNTKRMPHPSSPGASLGLVWLP